MSSANHNPFRALSPTMHLASRRWRAGKPLNQVRDAFPVHLREKLFGWGNTQDSKDARLLAILDLVLKSPQASPTWLFPPRRRPA